VACCTLVTVLCLTAHLAEAFRTGLDAVAHGSVTTRLNTNLRIVRHFALVADALVGCTWIGVRTVTVFTATCPGITAQTAIAIGRQTLPVGGASATLWLLGQALPVGAKMSGYTMPVGCALGSALRGVQTRQIVRTGCTHPTHAARPRRIACPSLSEQIAAARCGHTLNPSCRIGRLATIGRAMIHIAGIRTGAVLGLTARRTSPIGANLGRPPHEAVAGCSGACCGVGSRHTLESCGTGFIGADVAIVAVRTGCTTGARVTAIPVVAVI
jgi:hypothetical protein